MNSGVTGANLKRRITKIVTESLPDKLIRCRKIMLGACGAALSIGLLMFGFVEAHGDATRPQQMAGRPALSFEVASIKVSDCKCGRLSIGFHSDQFGTVGTTLKSLIDYAYDLQSPQVLGGPSWVDSIKYDINAKIDDSEARQKIPAEQQTDQVRWMLQSLLADRFQLRVSHKEKKAPVYALVVSRNGPKLTPWTDPRQKGARIQGRQGDISASDASISFLIRFLSQQPEFASYMITDETGLKGTYGFRLRWVPERLAQSSSETNDGRSPEQVDTDLPDSAGPSLVVAIQKQLGLKLESRKVPLDVLVIDHVEKPSVN